jgi:hypothetical protein
MVAAIGTFENGSIKLDKEYKSDVPVKVLVTFLADVEVANKKALKLEDFSFLESQKNLSDYKGSLSEAVIEERRDQI